MTRVVLEETLKPRQKLILSLDGGGCLNLSAEAYEKLINELKELVDASTCDARRTVEAERRFIRGLRRFQYFPVLVHNTDIHHPGA
jgi:hypothetical protein